MDILDYAIRSEKDGEAYYMDLAEKTEDVGIKRILTALAEDERRHLKYFTHLKEKQSFETQDSGVIESVKNVFSAMAGKPIDTAKLQDQVALYREAMEHERKSRDFYLQKADESGIEEEKKLLTLLAEEERKHLDVLSALVDFISGPEQWLENAEWTQLG